MHLSELSLSNFRSFAKENVCFAKSLTVLVGENNGGKSNIIDAVRLISSPSGGRRELFCADTDIRFSATQRNFEIKATFHELSPPQQGRLISATVDDTLQSAQFGLTYHPAPTQAYTRPKLWAGRFKGAPEPGARDMIRHVYLPPLRDAKRALSSGNPTRILTLLTHFLGDRDPDVVAQALARTTADRILTDVDAAVAHRLRALTGGVRPQRSELGFNTDERLVDIARDLRFKLGDHGIRPEDLRYSGHGFANLLYIATIAVELERTDDADLTLFLVEEPEAHLHPQLQAAVLNFLDERAEQSLRPKKDSDAPAGHLQVIVATHSPNLSAWVPVENLVVVRSVLARPRTVDGHGEEAGDDNNPVPGSPRHPRVESRCVPLAKLPLTDVDRRKVNRYLDVTKSALLFGGRVLLVEGIAEALLLPVIAKHHVLHARPDDLRMFRSVVLVPIDGVDFMPYAKALLSSFKDVRIAQRVVIVTDGDRHIDCAGDAPGERRKRELVAFAEHSKGADILSVFTSDYSLESDLVLAGNGNCMREVYLSIHPESHQKWDRAVSRDGKDLAKSVGDLFRTTPKGDFAQLMAERVATISAFKVPSYIHDAIESLVK